MRLSIQLAVSGLLIATTQLLILSFDLTMSPELMELPQIDAATLPNSIGDYVGRDEPLDERSVAASDADLMLNRIYRNRVGDSVVANVGIWREYGNSIPHRPDGCYPSAGWEIAARSTLSIPISADAAVDAKLFVFQRDTSRIAVAYWAQLGDRVFVDNEPIRQIRQRSRTTRKPLPPLIKVMIQTDGRDLELARAILLRLGSTIFSHTESIK